MRRFDDNIDCGRGDGDKRGGAYCVKFDFAPEKMRRFGKNLGKGLLRMKDRRRDERYQEIDSDNVVEFGRKWDIDDRHP